MSSSYSSQSGLFDRIHNFALAGANNELTEADWSNFEQLLEGNDNAFQLYIHYMEQSDLVQAVMDAMPDEDTPSSDLFSPKQQESVVSASPAPTFPATLFHSTLGFFSSGWPVAYLIATVVVGIGLWISSVTPASYPQQIAKRSSSTRQIKSVSEPQMEFVGQITGMAECRWAEGFAPLLVNDAVPVGREIRLESGLMQITYDNGAKVILQGPETYEVESATGGYLSVGKLTARVEGAKPQAANPKSQAPSPNSEGPHPSSLIPHPLFSVRTPTATVTDLGTEFGVDVGKSGDCEVYVMVGEIDVATHKGEDRVRLSATGGQKAVRVEAGSAKCVVLHATPKQFVRTMPKRESVRTKPLPKSVGGMVDVGALLTGDQVNVLHPGCTVVASSTYEWFGLPWAILDGLAPDASHEAPFLFDDADPDQRIAISGFNGGFSTVRIFTIPKDDSNRQLRDITLRSSTQATTSLSPDAYETDLGTFPVSGRKYHPYPDGGLAFWRGYFDLPVSAPPGTRSLLIDCGPAAGPGDRVYEVQAISTSQPP